MWSRSYFPAWRATIDGVPERPFPAERHLVGLDVPFGAHEVVVEWSTRPLAIGLALLACGILGVVLLYRGT